MSEMQESSDARPQFSEARRPKAARSPAFLTSGAGARHAAEPAPHQSQPGYAAAGSSIRSAHAPTQGAPHVRNAGEFGCETPVLRGPAAQSGEISCISDIGRRAGPAAEPAPHQSQPGYAAAGSSIRSTEARRARRMTRRLASRLAAPKAASANPLPSATPASPPA